MNNYIYLILFILSLSYTPISFSYHKCNKKTDIHCTYYIGNNSKKNGRYIKSTLISKNAISHIHCTSGGLSDIIPNAFGKGWGAGKRKFIYEQCLNAECKESKYLAADEFSILKDGKNYTSDPHSFNVQILSGYGQPCVVPTKYQIEAYPQIINQKVM